MYLDILCLIVIATGNIIAGAKLGEYRKKEIQQQKYWKLKEINSDSSQGTKIEKGEDNEEFLDLNLQQILLIPISSSLVLLVMFYFFSYIQFLVVIGVIFGTYAALDSVLFDVINYIGYGIGVASAQDLKRLSYYTIIVSVVVVAIWVFTGNYILHDILSSALCIAFISLVRFPSLKLASLCMSLLFLYDIYWVFFSEYFFNSNVMVSVATKNTLNPIYMIGQYFHITFLESASKTIELPLKLLVPSFTSSFSSNGYNYSVLGLGDITVPGLLVSLACEMDVINYNMNIVMSQSYFESENDYGDVEKSILPSKFKFCKKQNQFLFVSSLIGYIFGLICAFVASRLSNHAQPALLYLVPSVLSFISLRALYEGRFLELWNGPKLKEDIII